MNNENFNEIIEKIMGNTINFSKKEEKTVRDFQKEDLIKMEMVIEKINRDDENIKFLRELKPLLSEERQKKTDNAIGFLQLLNGIENIGEMM